MKQTFTPGPWKLGKNPTTVVSDHPVKVTLSPELVCEDSRVNDREAFGGCLIAEGILREENAQLIASAPDMFQALDDLLKLIDDGVNADCSHEEAQIWENARIAWGKAQGVKL